ncbi:glycosyltransferase family 2 protein [Helicobacter himalayensis]|uniref:glycosyltransferase family 2 protein n=1 Tax=Helicobacter himalayensis TaxID=1591088 RepID=UPI003D6F80C1
MARFSIILPVFNVQNYIARALESCINQSFRDIEIIIVDDCGQDKSMEIAKEFASKDVRIKIIHNEKNQGTFASRNNGALHSSGEYLLFLDSDDYLDLSLCEILNTTFLESAQEIDILGFNFFKQEGGEFHTDSLFKGKFQGRVDSFCAYLFSQGKGYWNLCNKAYKASTYKNVCKSLQPMQKLTMAEDAFMFLLFLFHAKNAAYIPNVLYFYCENLDSITQRNDTQKLAKSICDHKYVLAQIAKLQPKEQKHTIYARIITYDLQCSLLNDTRKTKGFFYYIYSSVQKKAKRLLRKRELQRLQNDCE